MLLQGFATIVPDLMPAVAQEKRVRRPATRMGKAAPEGSAAQLHDCGPPGKSLVQRAGDDGSPRASGLNPGGPTMLTTILRTLLQFGTGFTSPGLLVLQAVADASDGALADEVTSHCQALLGAEHSPP